MSTFKAVLTAGALGLTSLSAPAFALDPSMESVIVNIQIGDLDLNTPRGANAVYARIRDAVILACEEPRSPFFPVAARAEESCESAAMSDAVTKIDAPLLTARYEQSGRRLAHVTLAQSK